MFLGVIEVFNKWFLMSLKIIIDVVVVVFKFFFRVLGMVVRLFGFI